MKIDVAVEASVPISTRMTQLSAMFDAPIAEKQLRRWSFDAPIDDHPWNVGLIVGPSGAGKSQILRAHFPPEYVHEWPDDQACIDSLPGTIEETTKTCSAVGFNTVPAWMRPYATLSNGEQFRANIAASLLTCKDQIIVIDEFTSVVDRQVALVASNSVQKYARQNDKQIVLATCHYDITEWLQPDWVIEPHKERFVWRSVQPRPKLDAYISRVEYSVWKHFAPYHYLTAELNRSARCYALHLAGEPVAFAGVLPAVGYANIRTVSRLVTLPDYQGLGLALRLVDTLGAAFRARKMYFHMRPSHPSLIHTFDKSSTWALRNSGRQFAAAGSAGGPKGAGRRNPPTFRYCGAALSIQDADTVLAA